MKGVIYTRVSADEQVKGTSLEFQEEVCRKYCEDKGIEIVRLFREEGESAKDLNLKNRKEFLEALEFCRKQKNRIQAFVVLRVDRFARNTEDHFAVRKILLDYGVTLHSVSEPIGNQPAEKFIETVLAGAAEYDNAIRKQRSCDGMAARIKQGIYPFRPPLGYDCAYHRRRGEKKTMPDQPNRKIFPIIQRGLKEYAKGKCSQIELCELLDKWGLSAIKGKKTYPQIVEKMLGNYLKFYAGILVNPWAKENEPKEYQGLHMPMITEEEMRKILLVRYGKIGEVKRIKRERFNRDFPLKCTVKCGDCGHPLTGSWSRGRSNRYAYYHCYNRNCSRCGKAIKKGKVEKEFVEYLTQITPKDWFLESFQGTVLYMWREKGMKFDLGAKRYEKQLAKLKERKAKIYDLREGGSYSQEEFQDRKEKVENEIVATKVLLSEARIEQFDIEGAVSYATSFIKKVDRQWFDLSPRLRPRFQKMMFPDGIPYDRENGFGTAKLGLIYGINKDCAGKKSTLVRLVGFGWNRIIEELKMWEELRQEVCAYNETI